MVDGISSQQLIDRQIALQVSTMLYSSVMLTSCPLQLCIFCSSTFHDALLQRAVQSGAFLGTSEMLLFQVMQGAKVLCLCAPAA